MIFAVSTVKDTVLNVEKFVRRNLAGGVDHLLVFLDDEQPEVEELLTGSPHVTVVATHRDWWHGERQVELNDRQRTHATLAARMLSRFPWAQWMFHIDGDEVVNIDRQELAALADDVGAVHLSPLECVADMRAEEDPTWFKPLLDEQQLLRLTDLGVIKRPHNRAFFRGHTAGKVGVRPAPGIRVSIHSAVDATGTPIPAVKGPAYTVLHYESPNAEQFIRKWQALLTSGDFVGQGRSRRNLSREVGRLLDGGLATEEAAAQLATLYEELVSDDVGSLRTLGLLQHHDPDSWSHDPEPIPHGQAQAWAHAVELMRSAPKSAYLPLARRDAPLERPSGRGAR
ncbi:MAG: glycosyltransferase family 2 protein [Nocardioides sp.]